MNERASIGWTSYSHTGVPVPVYTQEWAATRLAGFYDNTDIAVVCIGLLFLDLAPDPHPERGLHARGLITAVDNSAVRTNLIIKTEAQVLTVRLLDGPSKGEEIAVTNMLTGKLELDEFYETGSVVLIEYDMLDGKPRHGMARGHYRLQMQLLLIGIFAALLIAVAGVTGLKAALSFIFAALVLWKLYFPLLLLGYVPIPTGLAIVAVLTGVITFSVGGLTRRGIATFSGSMLGVLLTCALAVWFAHAFNLRTHHGRPLYRLGRGPALSGEARTAGFDPAGLPQRSGLNLGEIGRDPAGRIAIIRPHGHLFSVSPCPARSDSWQGFPPGLFATPDSCCWISMAWSRPRPRTSDSKPRP
ncbi:YibE/F family protein [Thiocapsa sp.]|uniref:YibE/F family protein n=1 Tax=Thiocapsa sp. TaxID=2024551 RepID=UPI00359376A3